MASWGRGRFLVTYEPYDLTYAQFRMKFRLVSDPVNGAKCATGPDCTSGFCVEDVCCQSACEGGTCGGGTCTYPSASITCPGDVVAEATRASGAPVSYPAASATGVLPLSVTYSQASGSEFAPGSTSVTARLVDGFGRTASCGFSVTVRDTTAPQLTCPSPVQKADAPPEGVAVDYPAAIAQDSASTPTLSYSQATGTVFPVGTTQVTVTATDGSGNSATCTFPVSVAARVQPPPDEPLPSGGCGCGASSGTSGGSAGED
ncbi:HYR domain-containing protein [Corallococcus sp. CA053C]|uniref:HYR domain-containing protein n=1 Tax=Corallococcus sp. CA053C TaxID=2316732 RepID=UPI000EA346D0|nr:HYR domain-containing protein [Corallococcus sp. CA053C]RKH07002.1 HYR domain-containing protein [Corallococcus sp. CA053C]